MKKRQVVVRRSSGEGYMRSSSSSNTSNNSSSVRYEECQKNHAATMGRYAVDGCREFMPSGGEGSVLALVCAACGCHRNFHRKEADNKDDAEVVGESCSSPFSSSGT